MCRGRRRSYATSPGKLSSCNRRDHRRGLTLTCSRLKTATSCLQRAEVTSLQTRETNSKIRTVCFPSKAWCGRLDVGWWKQNGRQVSCVPTLLLSIREKGATCSRVVSWCSPVCQPAICFSSNCTRAGLRALHLPCPKAACHFCGGIKTPQCLTV